MAVKSKRKSKSNSNSKSKKLCYTGCVRTKKYHTKKEFLALMNKTNKKLCSRMIIGRKQCSSCKKYRREWRTYVKKSKKNPYFRMSNEAKVHEKNQDKLEKDCRKCKNKIKKECSLNEYMEYSGASYNC